MGAEAALGAGVDIYKGNFDRRFYKALSNTSWVMASFRAYTAAPQMQGCQVKMLNGYDCYDKRPIDAEMVTAAKRHIDEMAFVGIFEYYKESVHFWHEFSNPQSSRPPHPIELVGFRNSSENIFVEKGVTARVRVALEEGYAQGMFMDDHPEQEVYAHARRVFYERVRQHRLMHPESTCCNSMPSIGTW
mgnify:CR=1 FL=1